MIYNKK